jgi:uncharacterized protein
MTATQSAPPVDLAALRDHEYILLTTFRKNGQPVPTPVWFAEQDGRLYVLTGHNAGKVKRIRATRRVEVAPCNARGSVRGPSLGGAARVLSPGDGARVEHLLDQKYGWKKRGFDLLERALGLLRRRRARVDRDYLEIVPGA